MATSVALTWALVALLALGSYAAARFVVAALGRSRAAAAALFVAVWAAAMAIAVGLAIALAPWVGLYRVHNAVAALTGIAALAGTLRGAAGVRDGRGR